MADVAAEPQPPINLHITADRMVLITYWSPCLRGSARTERMALIGYGGRGGAARRFRQPRGFSTAPLYCRSPTESLRGETDRKRERDRKWGRETSREKRERPNHGKKNKKTTEWGKKKRRNWGKNKDGETKGGWGKCRKMQERQAFVRKSTETEKGEKTCIILLYCLCNGTYIWVDFTMPDCFNEKNKIYIYIK